MRVRALTASFHSTSKSEKGFRTERVTTVTILLETMLRVEADRDLLKVNNDKARACATSSFQWTTE